MSASPPSRSVWSRLRSTLLLVTSLALGIGGQLFFNREPRELAAGALLYALGAAALALGLRGIGVHPDETVDRGERATQVRVGRLIVGLVLAGLLTVPVLKMLAQHSRESFLWPTLLWIGALAVIAWATFPGRSSHAPASPAAGASEGLSRIPPRLRGALFALGLFALALALRVWRLDSIPPTLGGDEAGWGLDAVRILAGEIRNPFALGWLSVPTMSAFYCAGGMALFGQTVVGLRVVPALAGAATVVVVYFLASRLLGRRAGLLSALLLAAFHYHIHFSRLGAAQIFDGLFVSLTLLLLHRALAEGRSLDWALCGIVAGISQYSYAGARFTPVLLIFLCGAILLRHPARAWKQQGLGMLILVGAFLVAAAPMIQVAVRTPDDYNARVNQVGIIQNGWLEREADIRDDGRASILFDQFQRAALAYNVYADRTLWYGLLQPFFGFSAAVLFLIGLGVLTPRLLDLQTLPFVAWWWGATLLGGMLTVNPPSSMRLNTTAVPAVLVVAFVLDRSATLLSANAGLKRAPATGLAVVMTGVLCLQSLRTYFVDFTPTGRYGNPHAVIATHLGNLAREKLGEGSQLIFFGAPFMYVGFYSISYLAPERCRHR